MFVSDLPSLLKLSLIWDRHTLVYAYLKVKSLQVNHPTMILYDEWWYYSYLNITDSWICSWSFGSDWWAGLAVPATHGCCSSGSARLPSHQSSLDPHPPHCLLSWSCAQSAPLPSAGCCGTLPMHSPLSLDGTPRESALLVIVPFSSSPIFCSSALPLVARCGGIDFLSRSFYYWCHFVLVVLRLRLFDWSHTLGIYFRLIFQPFWSSHTSSWPHFWGVLYDQWPHHYWIPSFSQ